MKLTSEFFIRFVLFCFIFCGGCLKKVVDPPLGSGYKSDFSKQVINTEWRKTGGGYSIEDGVLKAENGRNHPLWLKRRLPNDIRITFTAWADSPDGDIKFELFGDGFSTSTGEGAYTATGYVLIFGGWKNTVSIIARMDEHGSDRKATRKLNVQQGKRYNMKVESKGKKISWWIDGTLFLVYDDPLPLRGKGHEYFAFNNWEAPVFFDDLLIEPL